MENKYYNPKKEEFSFGFEFEYLPPLWGSETERVWTKYNWKNKLSTVGIHDNCISIGNVTMKEDCLRVKFLDEENLKFDGWDISEDNKKLYVLDYEKPYVNCDRKMYSKVFIHYNLISKWTLITTGNRKYTNEDEDKLDKSITRFCGYIKNISELRKIIK